MKRDSTRRGARAALLALAALSLVSASSPRSARRESDAAIEAALRAHIETLSSDAFAGRKPGTEGETLTLRYLGKQWFDIGLRSGTNDPGHPWFAPVELVERTPVTSRARFTHGRRRIALPEGSTYVVTSGLRSLVESAPVIFVGSGNGPVPPRAVLAGRVAMLLDGKAGDSAPMSLAERQGRLLDAGASGVLTVLDGDSTITEIANRRAKAGYALASLPTDGDLEAFITPAAAATLLQAAGAGSLAALEAKARKPGFAELPLHLAVTLEATNSETRVRTHNLIAKLPGRRPQDGAVLLVAHWDHLGTCAAPPATDTICNGAVDNASGLAVITEVARILAHGRPLDRDVYFLATTGEEMGLLGAQAFTENPPLPLRQIVAAFNVDSDAIAPKGEPFAIVGKGMTGLDGEIARVVEQANRKLEDDDAANAYVKRQDLWAFMQHDVPAVMVSTAYADKKRLERFMAERYHKPGDEAGPDLELGGAVDDVDMLVNLVRDFADPKRWPEAGDAPVR